MPQGVVLKILDFKKQFEYIDHIITMEWKSRFEETLDELIMLPILSSCPNCYKLGKYRFRCCFDIVCSSCCKECRVCNKFGCIHCIDIVDEYKCNNCQFY